MSDNFLQLQVTERDQTLTPRQLRAAGFLPATLYGKKGKDSQNIQVRDREFTKAYKEGNRVFHLQGLHNPLVRVSQLQVDPLSQKVLNVEFIETTAAEAKASEDARHEAERLAELAHQELARKIAEEAANRPDEEETPAEGAPAPAESPEKAKAGAAV